jgi:hypothetical protein
VSKDSCSLQAQYAQHAEIARQLTGIAHLREGRIGRRVHGAFSSHLAGRLLKYWQRTGKERRNRQPSGWCSERMGFRAGPGERAIGGVEGHISALLVAVDKQALTMMIKSRLEQLTNRKLTAMLELRWKAGGVIDGLLVWSLPFTEAPAFNCPLGTGCPLKPTCQPPPLWKPFQIQERSALP